jgi:hypothetical protein
MNRGSLVITVNSIHPYREELPNLLALPAGGEARLRYQKKYLPTIVNYSALNGLGGLIAVRNRQTACFMPLRMITVAHAEDVGDTIYLRVQVGRIANLSETDSLRRAQVSSFDREVRARIGDFPNEMGADLMNAVFMETGNIDGLVRQWEVASEYNEMRAWGEVVRELAERFSCLNIPFLRVASMVGDETPIAFQPMAEGRGGFTVAPGHSYRLTLLQRTYTEKKGDSAADPGRVVEVQSPDASLSFPWTSQSISGKVDICDFPMSVAANALSRHLQLFLRIVSDTPTPPPLPIPLSVRRPLISTAIRWVAVAGFCVFISVFLFADTFGLDAKIVHTVERIATVGMILTGTGITGPLGDLLRKLSPR